ncbi:BnaC03g64820D [Brassica napus]|uniref:BnaC03g64820D protein n=1 Tax=Brassica napus TaxID=3708 RepID=A0A078GQG5_BRANA|nr:BnaC03g64820D [Brassica napus]
MYIEREIRGYVSSVFAYAWFIKDLKGSFVLRATSNLCSLWTNPFFLPSDECIINVYNQEYESAAAFWPDVHGRVIAALMISQVLLMGLLGTKHAALAAPFLIALPVLTIGFHRFCKGRYEPAFVSRISGESSPSLPFSGKEV